MSQVSNELAQITAQTIKLAKQIKEAKADIKVLTTEEKKLKTRLSALMQGDGLDVINHKQGKITVKTVTKKGSFNRVSVQEGLTNFFDGNEVEVERAMQAIDDVIPSKESTSLSITGLKTE